MIGLAVLAGIFVLLFMLDVVRLLRGILNEQRTTNDLLEDLIPEQGIRRVR